MQRKYGLNRALSVLTALEAVGFGAGCANTTGLEEEMSRLRREIQFVRQDLAKQKRIVEGLERRVTLVSLGKGSVPAPPPAAAAPSIPPSSVTMAPSPSLAPAPVPERTAAPVRRKTLPVVRLGANAQPKTVRPEEWVDPGAQDIGGPPLKFTMEGDDPDDDRLSVDNNVLSRPDPVLDSESDSSEPLLTSSNTGRPNPTRFSTTTTVEDNPKRRSKPRRVSKAKVKAAYRAALAQLREKKQPAEALKLFDAFLAAYPRSKFSDNAAYWRGECLMAQGQHKPAIDAFDALIQRHPRSPKVPFALVRKAESLLALKQKPAAITALKQVAARYADSEAAQTAKNLLAREASP